MKLHDVVYSSFLKQVDHVDSFMASDYHYILTGILETPHRESTQGATDHRLKCFWEAYDIFDKGRAALLGQMDLFKKNVAVMMNETRNLI